jgi:hypothetical protein
MKMDEGRRLAGMIEKGEGRMNMDEGMMMGERIMKNSIGTMKG